MSDLREKYWPRYCEENVWHLCHALPAGTTRAFAVFVSGFEDRVAMFRQRAAESEDEAILWDYHVFLLVERAGDAIDESAWSVIDPDSMLDSPCPADVYLRASFRELRPRYAALRPFFRLVPSAEYVAELATNRSHMRTRDGHWRSPPPPWPSIGKGTNLMRFVDMQSGFLGHVVDLPGLRAELGLDPQ